MEKGNNLSPIVKWAGGKEQELKYILPNVPDNFVRFIEPFVGGGAVYFSMGNINKLINDKSDELTTLYFLDQTRTKDIKHFCQLFNYLNEIQGIRKIDLLRSSFNSYSRMRRWMFYAKTLILSKIYRF